MKATGCSSAWFRALGSGPRGRRFKSCHPDSMGRFHVYVLRSDRTGRRYVGSCEDLQNRLREHNRAESASTRAEVPWRLVRSDTFATRIEAMKRERYYKTGKGRDTLARLVV